MKTLRVLVGTMLVAALFSAPALATGIEALTLAPGTTPGAGPGSFAASARRAAAEARLRELRAAEAGEPVIYNPKFYLTLAESYVDCYGLVPGDRVVGSLRDPAGRAVAAFEDEADANGHASSYFMGSSPYMFPGYKATFRVYSSTGALRGTYAAAAPAVSITSLDKGRSIARGTGPAGKAYAAYWLHPRLDATDSWLNVKMTGTIPATRAWSVDFGTTPFRGGDRLYFDVQQGTRFTFTRFMFIPHSYCSLAENYCWLSGFPNQPAALSIVHAGTPYTFSGRFSIWGDFSARPVDAAGMPVPLAAGDLVGGTGLATYALPGLTAAIDYATDVVSGRAPAGRYFSVAVLRLRTYTAHYAWTRASAAGEYSVDFSSALDLTSKEALLVLVDYTNPASGNDTSLYRVFGP